MSTPAFVISSSPVNLVNDVENSCSPLGSCINPSHGKLGGLAGAYGIVDQDFQSFDSKFLSPKEMSRSNLSKRLNILSSLSDSLLNNKSPSR